MAIRDPDGYLRIVGRKATDLIKSGGYKIGAGEIENALLDHPGVAEAAVTGEPDADLGERIVAWIVPATGRATRPTSWPTMSPACSPRTSARATCASSRRLPRNDMGKVQKNRLVA